MQTREELYDFLGYHAYEQKLDELFAERQGGRVTADERIASTASAAIAHARANWDARGRGHRRAGRPACAVVSGYTAYMQRQQVRAQVWPYLDRRQRRSEAFDRWCSTRASARRSCAACRCSSTASRSATGTHVVAALRMSSRTRLPYSTINRDVLIPGERVHRSLCFRARGRLQRFRDAGQPRAR